MKFETELSSSEIKKRLRLIAIILVGLLAALILKIGDGSPKNIEFNRHGLVTKLIFDNKTQMYIDHLVINVELSNYHGPAVVVLTRKCRIIDSSGSVSANALGGRKIKLHTIQEIWSDEGTPYFTPDVIFVEP